MHELNTDWVTLSPPWLTSSAFLSFVFHRWREAGLFTGFSSSFHPICIRNNLTLSLLSWWNVRIALGEECGQSMAFLCWFRHRKMMRGAFYSLSDSSANTAAVQPDMHFYSGQMSASSPALRIVCVAPEKVAASVVGTGKKKKARDIWGLISLPLASLRAFVKPWCVMLWLTSRPNRLMVRYVCIVALERNRLSGQKQISPRGRSCLCPSHRYSRHVPSCMQTWLLMKWTVLGAQTMPVYTSEKKKKSHPA